MAVPFLPILDVIGRVVDRVVPDPKAKAELQLQLASLADQELKREHEQMIAQTVTNTAEAQHRSIFVAGWRPFIGWGCGVALIYNTLIAPPFGLGVADLGFLQTILMGMLGIGAMRTVEKIKGVSNDVLPMRTPKTTTIVTETIEAPKKKGLDLWPF